MREIRDDLPRSFYLELPQHAAGAWQAFPRIFELAYELVAHTDSNLDEEIIVGFVEAYQRVAPLTTGEIWAIPIMLRLVLVENLRRLCEQMRRTGEHRIQAHKLLGEWQTHSAAGLVCAR